MPQTMASVTIAVVKVVRSISGFSGSVPLPPLKGVNVKVPHEIRKARKQALAIRWVITAAFHFSGGSALWRN